MSIRIRQHLCESHLLLLRLRIAIANNVVVLLLDFIQLDLKLYDLEIRRSATAYNRWERKFPPSRNGSGDPA